MSYTPPRCPDCSVDTERMRLEAGGHRPQVVSEEDRDGILGTLGVKQRYDAAAYVCPECGLVRLYAALDD